MRPYWPSGSYCIYMKSNNCPLGLSKGSFTWSAFGGGKNYQTGDVPNGYYNTTTTKIYYCCSSGSPYTPIVLPITSPFILLTSSQDYNCQKVQGAIYEKQQIGYDVNKTSLFTRSAPPHPQLAYKTDKTVIYLNYCYYRGKINCVCMCPSTNQTTNYPTNIAINQPCHQPISQPTKQPTMQPTNQPTDKPTRINKPTNQPTNKQSN